MKGVNLIPLHRRAQSRRRGRTRAWIVAGAGYTTLLGIVYLVCASVWAGDDQLLAQRLGKLPKDIDDANRAIAALQSQLDEAQSKLDASKAVSDQPDWSILLAVVGEAIGDEIVLSELRLDPMQSNGGAGAVASRTPPGPASRPAIPQGYVLNMAGMGRSQLAVSQFVLRLEQAGIFARVSLVKTNREMFGVSEAIAFRVEATISADPKGAK